ncbi:diguanylate cyclase/phosphodiesterase [Psychromonas ingrahamii 37]|uniref:Diguanylate cyclase/phosphodiesterase n=1 Tax=Psychromonas ingrahamii (strain DSM 17664 / CCUG 51855 / 37) TaxID=357804 RepID=A1SZ73_PSYIN|nr:EAL domain-containing protein [Psychromonas ingrahamii]ABM04788.1 diguanylate cyclase/phosphodiesterase [Psychromonas ingrahamii 37]
MINIQHLITGITGRITSRFLLFAALSILIIAAIGYIKIYQVTANNSEIRIGRAAHAAAVILSERFAEEFTAVFDDQGNVKAIQLKGDTAATSLSFRDEYDVILKDIGSTNHGAANLFKFNSQTKAFDRFVTTFRKPDGSMPPPMSISVGHPAYKNIINGRIHRGQVPVMGRLRLAELMPIIALDKSVKGVLAVDVGWVDDLIAARDELRNQSILVAGIILILEALLGAAYISHALRPIRVLAKYAEDMASEKVLGSVPFLGQSDEVGALSEGLNRVAGLQSKLAHLAYTDELTGLGNRSRYLADLQVALRESQSGNGSWVLLHLSIDKFSHLNDAYGQEMGDKILKRLGSRIQQVAGNQAKVARPSAADFSIIIDNRLATDKITVLAQNLIETMRKGFQTQVGKIFITGSIGVIDVLKDFDEPDEAHLNGNLALRKAQRAGGDQYAIFSSELNDEHQERVTLIKILEMAIEKREIEIHFQPQIILSSNKLAGLEALARWNHPSLGQIPPAKFIPIAEDSGQIVKLGTLIIDMACQQAAQWRKANFDFKHIAVNVSPIQLWQDNFIDVLSAALEKYKLPANCICIEITESVFIDNTKHNTLRVLELIRSLGVMLSLDDFGSGYSSLSYLNNMPFNQLKIDSSFVTNIDIDSRKQKVMRGILSLTTELDFKVIIEGTETIEEIMMVQEMGCDVVQGYYYAKPAPAALIPGIVNQVFRSVLAIDAKLSKD